MEKESNFSLENEHFIAFRIRLEECTKFFDQYSVDKVVINHMTFSIKEIIAQLKQEFDQQDINIVAIMDSVKQFKHVLEYYYSKTDINNSPIFSGMIKLLDIVPNYVVLNQKIQNFLLTVLDSRTEIEKNVDFRTGYLTKLGFLKALDNAFELVKKGEKKSLAVIFFDGNNLKEFNDAYGHEFGQKVIFKLGEVIAKELEKSGMEFQLSNITGGDERVALVSDVNKNELKRYIRKLFNTFRDERYSISGIQSKLGVCAGISYIKPIKSKSADAEKSKSQLLDGVNGFKSEDLLDFSDVCLLEAKNFKYDKRKKYPYVLVDLRKTPNIEDYKVNRRKLPLRRKKKGLKKKSLKQLIQLRKKYSGDLTNARIIEAKEILNNNIDLINMVISEKLFEENSNNLKNLHFKIDASIDEICKTYVKKIDDPKLLQELIEDVKLSIRNIFEKNIDESNKLLEAVKA